MADPERLKDIACWMMSSSDTYRDGVEVARAAYELQRLRGQPLNAPTEFGPSYAMTPDPEDD